MWRICQLYPATAAAAVASHAGGGWWMMERLAFVWRMFTAMCPHRVATTTTTTTTTAAAAAAVVLYCSYVTRDQMRAARWMPPYWRPEKKERNSIINRKSWLRVYVRLSSS